MKGFKPNVLHQLFLKMIEVRSPKNEKEWEEYYLLRYELLRKPLGQPRGSEKNKGDATGKHFALFLDNQLIGVSRLDTIDSSISQIRFFAVSKQHQGKGFGKQLLTGVEEWAMKNGYSKIILQARENAVKFYERNGYQSKEKTHLLFGKVQHYLMEKELF